jgi:hypothetical protein
MKKYNLFNKSEGTHDYVFTVSEVSFISEDNAINGHKQTRSSGTRYELRQSEASHWTKPGTLVFSAICTGDCFIIEQSIPSDMDCSTFAELHIFMSMIKNLESNLMSTYEVTEVSFEI